MVIVELSEDVINKIAAGEVIESPFSVVKELIENSIDAKATKIDIELVDSGKKKIVVRDNGIGMSKDDLLKCKLKHATSKIKTSDDLFKIFTLGFRGEALSSIDSISKLIVRSKQKDNDFGYELNENNKLSKISMNDGTVIIVKDLFYNTPARKKYLRSDYLELLKVSDLVKNYILAFSNIKFKLKNNDKIILQSLGNNELDNIRSLFKSDFTDHLIEIKSESDFIKISGFISEPGYLIDSSNFIIFFLNDRFIKSKLIRSAILDAYKSMIFLEQKPVSILHLYLSPEEFDINVHPQKLDVRFKNENDIYQSVFDSVVNAIKEFNKKKINSLKEETQNKLLVEDNFDKISYANDVNDVSDVSDINDPNDINDKNNVYNIKDLNDLSDENTDKNNVFDKENNIYDDRKDDSLNDSFILKENFNEYSSDFDENKIHSIRMKHSTDLDKQEVLSSSEKKYDVLDVIDNTYIVVRADNKLLIVDQHALHERLLFEKFQKDKILSNKLSQILLSPIVLELSSSELVKLNSLKDNLIELGFDFEKFGQSSIVIRKVPEMFSDLNVKKIFINLIETNLNGDFNNLATKACKAAIKAHDKLSSKQIETLLDFMFNSNIMLTCPHGRPFFIELNRKELDKRFKR